ncbi:TPA: hypothetical protein PXO03_001538 [Yersinia enterocolitica]|nr:hypothetical protein [Yersinia enterocolitica]HDL7465570.1 hypothetical protein [Yersinia enterocolitica]
MQRFIIQASCGVFQYLHPSVTVIRLSARRQLNESDENKLLSNLNGALEAQRRKAKQETPEG